MESLLGFEETTVVVESKTRGYKLVPWISWDEWGFVWQSLFSSSSDSIASALNRIMAWRSRDCLPVAIEVTASIIEVQQKDPFFRADHVVDNLHSEEMLSMLYCMAIMRLVNGVVEKTRKKTKVSIAEAADAIGLPRMLIDIRHEGSHRDLPSIRLLRLASMKALDWLKSYYWEPQKKAVACQRDGTAQIGKEIKSKLHELEFCLKNKHSPESTSLVVKGKRVKHSEQPCGRNKFFSLMAGKLHSSKSVGSKKHIAKSIKSLLRLYSSFSSELVCVLLEYMLKALDSIDLVKVPNISEVGPSIDNSRTISNEWKLVITKLSNKEPKLYMALLNAVLDSIETHKAKDYEIGQHLISLEYRSENHQIKRLSSLFAWLVRNLKVLNPSRKIVSPAENEDRPTDTLAPRANLVQLMRKCLLISDPGNVELMESAVHLAQMVGDRSLIEKLSKFSLLPLPNTDITEENPSLLKSESILINQEDYLRRASEKLEALRHERLKSKLVKTREFNVEKNKRWVIAKSWNPCPIGMLPCNHGSSGRRPVLDSCEDRHEKVNKPSKRKEPPEMKQCGETEASCEIELLDNSNVKRVKETLEHSETEVMNFSLDCVKGQLMIDGVWRIVREEELLAVSSAIRILV